jgi:hypothetical protein
MLPCWLGRTAERLQRADAAAAPENSRVHRFDGGHVWDGGNAIRPFARMLKQPYISGL